MGLTRGGGTTTKLLPPKPWMRGREMPSFLSLRAQAGKTGEAIIPGRKLERFPRGRGGRWVWVPTDASKFPWETHSDVVVGSYKPVSSGKKQIYTWDSALKGPVIVTG